MLQLEKISFSFILKVQLYPWRFVYMLYSLYDPSSFFHLSPTMPSFLRSEIKYGLHKALMPYFNSQTTVLPLSLPHNIIIPCLII